MCTFLIKYMLNQTPTWLTRDLGGAARPLSSFLRLSPIFPVRDVVMVFYRFVMFLLTPTKAQLHNLLTLVHWNVWFGGARGSSRPAVCKSANAGWRVIAVEDDFCQQTICFAVTLFQQSWCIENGNSRSGCFDVAAILIWGWIKLNWT